LDEYVKKGGGLVVAPPIGGLNRDDYNRWAGRLLPAEFPDPDPVDKDQDGVGMTEPPPNHPLTARLAELTRDTHIERLTRASRYWSVKPADKATVLLRYDDAEKNPALVERAADGAGGRGKVLLFTTAFDGLQEKNNLAAND